MNDYTDADTSAATADHADIAGAAVRQRIFTTWLTSTDRVDHAVTDEEFHDHRPEPEALCGLVIVLAAMEAPPGPRCARCTAFLTARESLQGLPQRLDPHRRPSWLSRLLQPGPLAPVVPSPRVLARDGRLHTPADTVCSPAAVSTGLHDGGDR